jgi:hypothetical protein
VEDLKAMARMLMTIADEVRQQRQAVHSQAAALEQEKVCGGVDVAVAVGVDVAMGVAVGVAEGAAVGAGVRVCVWLLCATRAAMTHRTAPRQRSGFHAAESWSHSLRLLSCFACHLPTRRA